MKASKAPSIGIFYVEKPTGISGARIAALVLRGSSKLLDWLT